MIAQEISHKWFPHDTIKANELELDILRLIEGKAKQWSPKIQEHAHQWEDDIQIQYNGTNISSGNQQHCRVCGEIRLKYQTY